MSLTSKGTSTKPIPEGVYEAVCVGLYDIGTQRNEWYDKDIEMVVIVWEIPELRIKIERDGEELDLPRVISQKYTNSIHPKSKLCAHLEGWRGKRFTDEERRGFSLIKVLGVSCQLQILHNDKGYANVATLMPLKKKITPENPLLSYDVEEKGPFPEGMPKWIIELVEGSLEFKGFAPAEEGPPPIDDPGYDPDGQGDDGLPF